MPTLRANVGSLLGCTLAAALLASGGSGTQSVETTLQDDAALLHQSPAQVRQAVFAMKDLGVDRVRVTAGWSVLAPRAGGSQKPAAPFEATDSSTYPQAGFEALDRVVRDSYEFGMKVQIDLAFWAPRWATARRSVDPERQRYIPDPTEFAKFATAIAGRYSGRFTDPRHGILTPLPHVDLYTTWNEPNKVTFLQPQYQRFHHRWRPYSPHVYRPMHEQAYSAIKAVDPEDKVLIGGLASKGGKPGVGGVPPLEFLRTLACVTRSMKPLRVPECRHVGMLHADGLSLHPYSLKVTPGTKANNRDNLYLADLQRADDLVDQLAQHGRIDSHWPLYVTEYGYESKPPDPSARFSPAQQARNLGWATFLANSDPSVREFAQFLLKDSGVSGSGGTTQDGEHRNGFQTGLLFSDGAPKPAAQAFKYPLFLSYSVDENGTPGLLVYGGVRPGNGTQVVRLERRAPNGIDWLPVQTTTTNCNPEDAEFLTDPNGFFRRAAPWEGPGYYRLAWFSAVGTVEYGATIHVTAQPLLQLAPPATG